jgi:hypothetical protein
MRAPQNSDHDYTPCALGRDRRQDRFGTIGGAKIHSKREVAKRLRVALAPKWDQEFESAFLQQPVCLSGEPRV